ncbi:recombinase family protein [Streptomyces sp. NPDC050421]|uniref:recombinase family protein n=1 Tax=Streptomyces sp. NPDC050421 TaxID=3365613 RepID=UPI0037A46AE6
MSLSTFRASPGKRNRASLYIRLSRQADDSNLSLEGMTDDVRDLCRDLGYREVALHVDDGLTGGYRDRPEFLAWVDDAKYGRADALLAWHVDRMTREGLNVAAAMLDVVEGKDPLTGRQSHSPVRLVDTRGLDSNDGESFRFRFVLQAEVARAERERMRDRAKMARRRGRAAGRWPGGPAPFGYRIVPAPDGKGKVLDVEPTEAAAIRECVDRVLANEPESFTRCVAWMNAKGPKPRRAKAWSRVVLRQVLVGNAVLGRATSEGKLLRTEDGEIFTPFPAVITPGESAALRQALAVKTPNAKKGGRRPSRLLSGGGMTCHSCKSGVQVARYVDTGMTQYRCQTKANGGICKAPVSCAVTGVEDLVESLYLGAVGHMPFYRQKIIVEGVDELAIVETEIADTLAEIGNAATAELFAKLTKLQARRGELEEMPPAQRVEYVPTGFTMAQHWTDSTIDDRRVMLRRAFALLELQPGKRGKRGFDPARLKVVWNDEYSEYDEAA